MKNLFRLMPLASIVIASALGLSSCSKDHDVTPTPKATSSSNSGGSSYIYGPDTIPYGQEATYRYLTGGYPVELSVESSSGFVITSYIVSSGGGNVTIVVKAPDAPSDPSGVVKDLAVIHVEGGFGGDKQIEAVMRYY